MSLTVLDHLPSGLLERPAAGLHQQLTGPTLIHLKGKRPEPLFISVLQHGNETTGWEAARRLLKHRYPADQLPRSLSLFIGNVRAARQQLRHLPDQPDFNRCWPGGDLADNEYDRMFHQVTDQMRAMAPFASVDIHNNTGLNPHYAAINRLDHRFFHLARMFSNIVIHFQIPRGVQSNAFADFCPSVTLECGQASDIHGTDHSLNYLLQLLQLEELPSAHLSDRQVDLFHMVATVRVPDELSIGFGTEQRDINFIEDLDHLNFRELAPGTAFGQSRANGRFPLEATDLSGNEVTRSYFKLEQDLVKTKRRIMPSMLTIDSRVIRQDCLCYLMERLDTDSLRRQPAEPLPEPNLRD